MDAYVKSVYIYPFSFPGLWEPDLSKLLTFILKKISEKPFYWFEIFHNLEYLWMEIVNTKAQAA